MTLMDEDQQRWYCFGDDLYYAKDQRWSKEGPRSANYVLPSRHQSQLTSGVGTVMFGVVILLIACLGYDWLIMATKGKDLEQGFWYGGFVLAGIYLICRGLLSLLGVIRRQHLRRPPDT